MNLHFLISTIIGDLNFQQNIFEKMLFLQVFHFFCPKQGLRNLNYSKAGIIYSVIEEMGSTCDLVKLRMETAEKMLVQA